MRHTNRNLATQLRELRSRLLAMGARCEQLIVEAVASLDRQEPDPSLDLVQQDRQINEDEMALDELAHRLLALWHPVGRDLRLLVATLKVVVDLERIGDEGINIWERAPLARVVALAPARRRIPVMADHVASMLRHALDAFVKEDAQLADRVLEMDDHADALYGEIFREAMSFMAESPAMVEHGLAVANCAKYLERVADHCTNIAEMVIYLVRGDDIRHSDMSGYPIGETATNVPQLGPAVGEATKD